MSQFSRLLPRIQSTRIVEVTSGAINYDLPIPGGSSSLLHLLAQRGQHPTYNMNVRLDPTQASAAHDLAVVFQVADPGYPTVPSLDVLNSALEVQRTEGQAALIGRVVDCRGRPIEHAVVTLSTASGEATTYYFSVAPSNLPVATNVRHVTDREGEFFVPEIPASSSPFTVRAWGFLTASDVASGVSALKRIGDIELPISAEADVIGATRPATVLTDVFPTDGPL